VRSGGSTLDVAKWLDIPEFSRWKIDQSVAELLEERELVREMIE
jgi:hypothetical protein